MILVRDILADRRYWIIKRAEYIVAVSRLVRIVVSSPSGSGTARCLKKLDSDIFISERAYEI